MKSLTKKIDSIKNAAAKTMTSAYVSVTNKLQAIKPTGLQLATANAGMTSKRKGAFAFEYIIVLVLMVTVIIAGWTILGDMVVKKATDVSNTVNNVNGKWTTPGGK